MGYRSLRGPAIIDFEKMVPITPRVVSKIKVSIQQQLNLSNVGEKDEDGDNLVFNNYTLHHELTGGIFDTGEEGSNGL